MVAEIGAARAVEMTLHISNFLLCRHVCSGEVNGVQIRLFNRNFGGVYGRAAGESTGRR
jgi:hypothetical protein